MGNFVANSRKKGLLLTANISCCEYEPGMSIEVGYSYSA